MNEKIKIIIILTLILIASIYMLNLIIKDYKLYQEARQKCKDEGYNTLRHYKKNLIKNELKEIICIKHITEIKTFDMRTNNG